MPDKAGPGPVWPAPAGTVSPGECRRAAAALERLRAKLTEEEEWRGHVGRVAALRETLDSPLFAHVLALQRAVAHLEEQLSPPLPEGSRRSGFAPNSASAAGHASPPSSAVPTDDSAALALEAPPSPDRLRRWIAAAAAGRPTERVHLTRPASGGLGFSVAGLHPGSGGPDVFVKHIQPGGVADRDGRLQVLDQILAINGRPLEAGMSRRQALAWLQMPGRTVDLMVARDRTPGDMPPQTSFPSRSPPATADDVNAVRRAQPHISTSSGPPAVVPSPTRDCGATFSEAEEIQLLNDGSGLGFGIVGGKTGGVVVRTLVGGGTADRDGRLRAGDRILRIGATPTDGLSSDEVVQVLRACGSRVTMLVARGRGGQESKAPPPPPPDSAPVSFPRQPLRRPDKTPNLDGYEIHEVALTKKDGESLGISIIGQNPLTSHDAVGVFIKHVVPGSAAHHSGNIRVQDRLIALDGVSLHGLTNQEVVEVMKQTGRTVRLTLVRRNNTAAERSLDRVESSRGSLRRSPDFKMTYLDTHNSTPEAALKAKWQKALGPNHQVLVVKLHPAIEDHARPQRSSKLLPVHTLRLGLELDSFDGHHYLSCVVPGGPVDKDGVLKAEDELLEVNRVPLCGKSRREVLSFLKETPPPFTLVCCRQLTSDSEAEKESEGRGRGVDDEWEEEGGELALWSSEVDVLELHKEAGESLGFSILDYQDPLDPGGCVMVIRSLVAGGAAERAGALLPGDQLVSVNGVRLEGLSLERAVSVLKGAPPGVVRLGLRKPLVGSALGPAEEEAGLDQPAGPPPAPSSLTSDPAEEEEDEGGEMAVDDDETETTAPPSWEQWKAASSDTRQTKDGPLPGETLILPAVNSTQNARAGPRSDAEADSELSSTDTESVVRMIDAEKRRRRSHGGFSAARRGGGELPEREQGEGEETPRFSHWGPPRRVEVRPEAGESLGLSIVGGHHVIKRLRNGEELKGIFIKQVLRGSPAHATRALKTGDKILQVSGVDLRAASHEEAVHAIKSAESPVVFVVQSLSANPRMVRGAPPPYRPPGQSERELLQAPQEPWRDLPGEPLCVELDKEAGGGVGLSLAGNRDRRALGVFVAGLRPGGVAATDGRVRVGDQLLQVNDQVLYGRSHHKASALIKSSASKVKLVLLRGQDGIRHVAVPPFPPPPESVSPPAGDPLVPAEWPHPPEHDMLRPPSEEDTDAEVVGAHRENDGDDPEEAPVTTCESDDDIGAASPDTRAGSPASRDPSTRPVLPGQETTLEIRKGRSGLGLSVAGGADTQLRAVVILEVYDEGAAAKDGRLLPGDRILEVNGADLRRASHEEAVAALRRPCSKVAVKVLRRAETDELRLKAGRGPGFGVAGKRSGRGALVSELARGGAAEPDGRLTRGDEIPSVDGEDAPNTTQEAVAAILKLDDGGRSSKEVEEEEEEVEGGDEDTSCPARDTSAHLRTVHITRAAGDSLGLSIAGGRGSPLGDVPVFIAMIRHRAAAADTRRLKVGDRIVSINGQSLDALSHHDVVGVLKEASGNVCLQVVADTNVAAILSRMENLSSGGSAFLPPVGAPADHAHPRGRGRRTIAVEKTSDGFGFTIVGGVGSAHGDLPIYVKTVFNKGAAAADGHPRRGDQVLSVNGESLDGVTHEQAVAILQKHTGTVTLELLS